MTGKQLNKFTAEEILMLYAGTQWELAAYESFSETEIAEMGTHDEEGTPYMTLDEMLNDLEKFGKEIFRRLGDPKRKLAMKQAIQSRHLKESELRAKLAEITAKRKLN